MAFFIFTLGACTQAYVCFEQAKAMGANPMAFFNFKGHGGKPSWPF